MSVCDSPYVHFVDIRNASSSGWLSLTTYGAVHVFRRAGIKVVFHTIDALNKVEVNDFISRLNGSDGRDRIFFVNWILDSISIHHFGVPFDGLCKLKKITYIVDNPAHHHYSLESLPPHRVLIADDAWVGAASQVPLDLRNPLFFPMWVASSANIAKKNAYPYEENDQIDILFVGDLPSPGEVEGMINLAAGGCAALRDAMYHAVEENLLKLRGADIASDAFAEDATLHDLLKVVPPKVRAAAFAAIDTGSRARYRSAVLRSYEKVKVVIAGEIRDKEIASKQNFVFLGKTSISHVENLAAASRILIGDTAGFINGVELRPSIAARNGALHMGCASSYHVSCFSEDAIEVFDDPQVHEDVAVSLLSVPKLVKERAEIGRMCLETVVEESSRNLSKNMSLLWQGS